ncbi:neuropeptide CCHamide-1 receptor-like [Artemia franciscana]|uniref:G-protein coupled receptors family 1 profile domain-containing protein n=1 Tax=Artemia franciscana TaxID=6661 RepID=A0AA88HT01_ARTSF|nr:hypothetical protein QYM36_006943 [Artemia franciscana]
MDNNYDVPLIVEETDLEFHAYAIRPETYFVPIIFSFIFITGIIGNGSLIVIYCRHRAMRTVPNTFVLSLSIGDLLVILITVPFTAWIYTFESWHFGEIICIFSEFVKDVSTGVSVFTLAVLSAERYWAIIDPLGKYLHKGSRVTILTVISIWLASSLIAVPTAINTRVETVRANVIYRDNGELYNKTKDTDFCSPYPLAWLSTGYHHGIIIGRFIVYYALPLVVISYYYIRMALHLMRQASGVTGDMMRHGNTLIVRKKVAKMVLIFVFVFFLCFTPYYVFTFWFWFHDHTVDSFTPFWNYFRIVSFCLVYVNSCANPLALLLFSQTYRKCFFDFVVQYLLCRKTEVQREWPQIERGTSLRTSKSELLTFYRQRRETASLIRKSLAASSVAQSSI